MTTPDTETRAPWAHRSLAARVLPPVLALALVAAVAVVATAAGRGEPNATRPAPSIEEMRAYAEAPERPVTYDEAVAAGTVDQFDWGDQCDTDRPYDDTDTTLARLAIPSTYAPPCVPVWGGTEPWVDQGGETHDENGGATSPGVSAETIKVVFYQPTELDVSNQLSALGVADDTETTLAGIRELVDMNNALYETYGRKVELVPFEASGDGASPASATADAVEVVEMGAFASIGGPNQTSAYQRELARNGVLCMQCGYASTNDVLQADAPYAWGYLGTPDDLLFGAFGYGTSLLEGSKAIFAGSPELRNRERSFGIVHYEQDPPVFGPLEEEATQRYAAQGVEATTIIQYLLDPNSLNAQAQAIVGRLKRAGVTSVVFLGDPLMPRLLTQQATKQDYFPEWIFTGTVFTDTTAIGRLYDQRQMASAFGTSSAAARTAPEASESWRLHEWWFGEAPSAPRTQIYWGPVVQMFFLGIHLAGPELTPETFAGGLFDYPPTGGTNVEGKSSAELFLDGYLDGDTTPAIDFGFTEGADQPDFVAVEDFTTVWWNPDAQGPDEAGVDGRGMWMYPGLGLRSSLQNPEAPDGVSQNFLFQTKLSQTGSPLAQTAADFGIDDITIAAPILEQTPPLNVLPDYPPRPDSPNARGN